MESPKTWLGVSVPGGWGGVVATTVMTSVVAFASLLIKEWLDSREWDFPGCAVDGACVGVGIFLVNAILKLTKS